MRPRTLIELGFVSFGFLLGTMLTTLSFWTGRLFDSAERRILKEATDSLNVIVAGRGVCWAPRDTIQRRTPR